MKSRRGECQTKCERCKKWQELGQPHFLSANSRIALSAERPADKNRKNLGRLQKVVFHKKRETDDFGNDSAKLVTWLTNLFCWEICFWTAEHLANQLETWNKQLSHGNKVARKWKQDMFPSDAHIFPISYLWNSYLPGSARYTFFQMSSLSIITPTFPCADRLQSGVQTLPDAPDRIILEYTGLHCTGLQFIALLCCAS